MSGQLPDPEVTIVHLDADTLAHLASGDALAAERTSPVSLSPWLVGPDCRSTWQRRSQQLRDDPSDQAWVTGVIWDPRHSRAVAKAGFHARPDSHGMVEIGYAVDPQWRRRGYARAAVRALLARAAQEPEVRVVRASVSPDNEPSLLLIAQFGFKRVGEQWDEEDGLEWVHEVSARGSLS